MEVTLVLTLFAMLSLLPPEYEIHGAEGYQGVEAEDPVAIVPGTFHYNMIVDRRAFVPPVVAGFNCKSIMTCG
jgi:hypothetical protein